MHKHNYIVMCAKRKMVSPVLILILYFTCISGQENVESSNIRIDCHPDQPVSTRKCEDRGCIWMPSENPLEPTCIFPVGYGYHVSEFNKTRNGYRASLYREPKKTIFGNEVDNLKVLVLEETPKRLRIKIEDKSRKRYEVPLNQEPKHISSVPYATDYEVSVTTDSQFGILVKRLSTGTIIFDTNVPGMVFSDQFLQITIKLPSANIYGLGEHYNEHYKHNTTWNRMPFFARDFSAVDPKLNTYGVHPFYMNVENDGNAHGVLLLNSNGMEVVMQPFPAITFRTFGGILDFYIFLGPTPENVVQQYLEVIGLPMMPPYWGLGFQLSRYGYNNTGNLKKVISAMIENRIPYDVQYLDIDYMDEYKDFTVDNENFEGLADLMNELHSQNDIKLVPIVDPAIANDKTLIGKYSPLDMGNKMDIFVKDNGKALNGRGWPGSVFYPDFSHPNALPYWTQMITEFHKILPFDGLWIDMNEPSNLDDGSLSGCSNSSLNYPPYAAGIMGSQKDNRIYEKTICMDAEQHAGLHYDVHNLYGTFEAIATHNALLQLFPGKRPMTLSRSTYPGSGFYAAHWLGDNFSTWRQMQASISGILEFNLFGFPFVGADICGFNDDTTEELCYRWMQLGAFYPFSRNHNILGAKDQDPTSLGERVLNASRLALNTRYELLPYLYTLFHFAHTEGATVARPLLHEFPHDSNTWGIRYQFLWGPALLISPILFEGATSVQAYFPHGLWYDFYSGKLVKEGSAGYMLDLPDNGLINLHVRGGYILPLQKPDVTTTGSRENPMKLFIAPNEMGQAKGSLFLDDGVSYETQETETYTFIEMLFRKVDDENAVFSSEIKLNNYPGADKLILGYITICNQRQPSDVSINGVPLGEDSWEYNESTEVLKVRGIHIDIAENFEIKITY